LTFEHLAEVLGENELTDTILDALMKDLERRLKASNGDSSAVVVADTFLPRCIAAGAARTPGHFGYPVIRTYNYLLSPANSSARILAFPVHSPPNHWMACHVDITEAQIRFGDGFRGSPPKILSKELAEWLQVATEMAHPVITNDLPCGEQHDVVNCGIIAVNAIAHSILGDVLWQSGDARTHRFRAFCTIADMILTHVSLGLGWI
jgi:Ulp1 family protease